MHICKIIKKKKKKKTYDSFICYYSRIWGKKHFLKIIKLVQTFDW